MTEHTAALYRSCTQCPRACGVNRAKAKTAGYCGETQTLRIASACLHFGEEPPVTANGGSGTIFITGCNLRCAFCQNYQISQQGMGAAVSQDDFVRICLALQDAGAENINIVTGSHAAPLLSEYIRHAKACGLALPVCWNSSAYETAETLELLADAVDIWLPDLKTLNPHVSGACFCAEDYPERAKAAISFMLDRAPPRFAPLSGGCEKMLSGVIIRHLFLPGRMDDTRLTLDWLKTHADGRACISLMSQYTPVPFPDGEKRLEALSAFENRLVSEQEFRTLTRLIGQYEFEYLFYQELEPDTEWLPDFTRTQPFSNELAKPVWHWAAGFCSAP